MNIKNTIIARNTAARGSPDCSTESPTLRSNPPNSQGLNLIQNTSGCAIAGDLSGVILGQDPRLGLLQSNGGFTFAHALLAGTPFVPGSLAIDAGNPAVPGSGGNACEATDQRGMQRPQDGDGNGNARGDSGAFELTPVGTFTLVPGQAGVSVGERVHYTLHAHVDGTGAAELAGAQDDRPTNARWPGCVPAGALGRGEQHLQPVQPGGRHVRAGVRPGQPEPSGE